MDDGKTWSSRIDVAGRSNTTFASGNPMAVYDAKSNRVLVVFGAKDLHTSGSCSPGSGVFIVHDHESDGVSWSQPRNISSFLGYSWQGLVPGPGNAIALTDGPTSNRLVFSGSVGAYNRVIVFFSDDSVIRYLH